MALALAAALCLSPTGAWADDAAHVPIDEEHFPDPQFREFILEDGEYDTDGDGALSPEELAAVTTMNCSDCYSTYYVTYGRRLYSLKGIEYFTSLTELDCSFNEIEELDLSKNTELKELDCSANEIKSLDLSKNTKLEKVYADNNKLTSLNVRGITTLEYLDCYINELTELDVSDTTAWLELSCEQNNLTQLRVSSSTYSLRCSENQLSSLDLSNYGNLQNLECSSNKLSRLNVSGCANLREVQCSGNRISQLDLSGCTYLSTLNCSNNRLASLDLSDCKYLLILDCSNNQLTSLDLTMRDSAMKRLTCADNAYTVDVEKGRTISLSALPGKFDAMKASGWSGGTVADGVLTVDDDVASVTYSYDCGYGQTATFTLNAGFAVSFDTGGGGKVDGQTVKAGEKATRPENGPVWAGHVFCGWYADKGCTVAYDFDSAVTGATTVYAKWVEDAEAPTISGIKHGETYCAAQKVTVADKNLGSVTVNGAAAALDDNGSFTLSPAAGEQKVVATDRAGNSTTVTATVNDGHTWGEGWSHDADEHWRVCSVCGEKGDVAEHTGGTATCVKKVTCEVCGEECGEVDPSRHEHTETLPAKAATCTEDGLTEGSKCTDCGEVLVEQKAVPASGHKGGTATCVKKAECEVCGEEYGKLDPENHEALEHVAAKEATAEAEGNVEYWRCTGCGKLFSDAAGTTEISKADTVIPKLDPKKDEGDKTDDGNGSNGGGSNDNTNGAAGGGSNASNGSTNGTNGGTATKTTVTTVTAAGKANSGLARTGDAPAAAATLALATGLTALGAALIRSKRHA